LTQTDSLFRPFARRLFDGRRRWLALGAVALISVGGVVYAQIEGERGIAPVLDTGNIEVGGIAVNTTGKTAQEARAAGWKTAYKAAWAKIGGPGLDDGTLSGLVTRVEVEHEQVGPHRYVATLGVEFDRQRATGYITGGGARASRSGPMLVIPVLYSGGVAQVFEVKGSWQRAWAEFHTGASAIDYVRPSGAGGDSLLLTAGQPGRRSRAWWRGILDQYGAAGVVVPAARLERQWPGGPVQGTFTARYGDDDRVLSTFTLTAPDEGAVPAMLAQAVVTMDQIYTGALADGRLGGDASLSIDHPQVDPGLAQVIVVGQRAAAADQARAAAAAAEAAPGFALVPGVAETTAPVAARPAVSAPASYTVQFASPDARAVDQALAALRGTAGVSAAATTSIAIGGTSVMRVTYAGPISALAATLRDHGWQVAAGASALRIHR